MAFAKKKVIVSKGAVVPAATAKAAKLAAAECMKSMAAKYGEGTLVRMGDRVGVKIECIRTNIYTLDNRAIQAGGVPRGRIIEIFGPASSGKTTLTLQIIAEAQATGGLAGFIDAEHALDPNWATLNGVHMDDLIVNQPDNGEQALDILENMVRSGAFDVIVVDSVAALTPQAELNGEIGESHVGLQARLMSQGLRKLTGAISKSRTTVIFINQIREKIGTSYGNPEVTTGGKALPFYASVRIDVRKIATVKDGEVPVGARTKFKIVKNKVGAPFRETEVTLLFASGYDVAGNLIEAASESGVVEKAGAWYSYAGERIGQGVLKASEFLNDNPELYEKIYAATVKYDDEQRNQKPVTA
jgi:recombination protein RecA